MASSIKTHAEVPTQVLCEGGQLWDEYIMPKTFLTSNGNNGVLGPHLKIKTKHNTKSNLS